MISWQALQFYLPFDQRWYETAGRHLPEPEHLAVFRSLAPDGWRTRRRGLWFIADPPAAGPGPAQGWKLHVTALPGESVQVLRLALPVLLRAGVRCKFLIDPYAVRLTGNKTFSRTASGKFITVYPADEQQFHAVGGALAAALEGRTGPYILSDRRWPGSTAVYYRYGGFAAVNRLRPDGLSDLMISAPDGTPVPDVRAPYFEAPDWAVDPFPPEPEEPDAPLAGRYTPHTALAFGNRGGVYLATDAQTGRDVVLKEARPGVMVGRAGRWAADVLAKEYRLLTELADTGLFVRPVDFFHECGHAFLVEEVLDGLHYGRHSIVHNPVVTLGLEPEAVRAYLLAQRTLWRGLALAVAAAHERGILLGDLSYTNAFVSPDGATVRILDLETAVREDEDHHLGIYTVGLASPRLVATDRYDRAADWHALGALVLSSLMVVNNTTGFHRPALPRFLAALAEDLALPAELVDLVGWLTDAAATDEDFDGAEVVERIDALPLETHPGWDRPVPLALPATVRHHGTDRPPGPSDAELAALTEQVAAYAEAVADPQREDRLFPADPLVFQTNPLSVAYGAMGVLHGLHRLRGEVPERLLAWALARDVDPGRYPPGLYLGQAGIAWVFDELGRPEVAGALMDRARVHPLRFADPGVLHGAAGYGTACLHLWQRLGDDRLLTDALEAGEALAAGCVRDERGARWPQAGPDGERVRVGHGHGASGIALFLLYLHLATGQECWYRLGREALAFDLGQGTVISGRALVFPGTAREPGAEGGVLRNYWDEGTAGVTTTVLRYLAARPDAELLAVLPRLLADSARKYTVLPQLFHGLAGLGNVLLDAGELLHEERWFAEARRVAEGVLLSRIDRPQGVVFPGEQALRESTDFATGSIGVALFLDRLRHARPGGRTNFNFTVDGLLP
ncbi:class III lanthionine synthetase LanKC [Kitasatospora sp. MBT63]|uniref:class III lanthionine synthetase LanKC n=1 Tax=Kitasatospora sp. MBT63 TaxID=1444768 RepID=UPI00053B0F2E|nr:class III lanthionine synthetase LanKC [Kitasatospora sp. MBT63]